VTSLTTSANLLCLEAACNLSPPVQTFRRTLVEDKVLTANQIYDLFCNVDDLIACTSPLAHALDARQRDGAGRPVERVGDEFKNAFSLVSLEAYAKFCANQKYAAQLYSQLLEVGSMLARAFAAGQGSLRLHVFGHLSTL